jgi:prevent-host-death family protein
LNRVIYQNEHVVLQRHGKRVAAIVPIADFELLQSLRPQLAAPAPTPSSQTEGLSGAAVLARDPQSEAE